MKNLFSAFKPILSDLLSTILFVAVYAATGSIHAAIAFGIAAGIVQIAWMKHSGRAVATMQWMSLGLVIVLGAATLLTRDARFAMLKPSIGTFVIGLVMLKKNWMGRYLPPIVTNNVSPAFPIVWGYIWAASLFALSLANLVVALTMGAKIWAWFNSIVPAVFQISLFLLQYVQTRRVVTRNIRRRIAAGEDPELVTAH